MMDVLRCIGSLMLIAFSVWVLYRVSSRPVSEPAKPNPKERLTDEQEQQLNDVVEVYVQRADLLRQQDNLLHGQPVSVVFGDNKNLTLSQEAIATALSHDIDSANRDLCRLLPDSRPESCPESRPESRFSAYRGRGKS